MTSPPTDPGAPDPVADDPMLRVLRERHPEVDVVVLPQRRPVAEAPEVDPVRRDALAADLELALDDLLTRLAPDAARHDVAREDGRWHTDEWDQNWYECAAVVGGLDVGENVALLRETGRSLVELGWRARPVPGDRPRLVARARGGAEATATVRPTSLVLRIRTARVRLTDVPDGLAGEATR
ncbi:hypothetical protein [Nocardioides hwasunensis]|uniref:Uncharacterized protein n=1 Tax=Nocardioides hwasunensis TaxID=397258 RepID=A0ABR8MG21_9ACTN|nr:hypothetical protein [Nocardioides hwasunensis]MBD3914903.1 hypothetical protein [Nocardioides hwasunensis]